MHSTPDVDTTTAAKKPSVISFYNENKVGVDCFDQMARLYTTRSASRRWPLAVWANILDIAAINPFVPGVLYVGRLLNLGLLFVYYIFEYS